MEAWCINLRDRPDRWLSVQDQLRKLDVNVRRFEAIRMINGHDGCIASHIECMKQARDYYEFMILEDDVKIIGSIEQFHAAYDQLPNDYDALYLGATLTVPLYKYSTNLYRLKGGLTTHAIVWNNQNGVVDYMIRHLKGPWIDGFMSADVQEKFNCYVCYPIIATQEEGYSDIVNRVVDYKVITETYKRFTE